VSVSLIGKRRCVGCAFAHADKETLECRRNPPNVSIIPMQSALKMAPELKPVSIFPPVSPETWCGEFIAKPERAN
jgi:hypothetical protein